MMSVMSALFEGVTASWERRAKAWCSWTGCHRSSHQVCRSSQCELKASLKLRNQFFSFSNATLSKKSNYIIFSQRHPIQRGTENTGCNYKNHDYFLSLCFHHNCLRTGLDSKSFLESSKSLPSAWKRSCQHQNDFFFKFLLLRLRRN